MMHPLRMRTSSTPRAPVRERGFLRAAALGDNAGGRKPVLAWAEAPRLGEALHPGPEQDADCIVIKTISISGCGRHGELLLETDEDVQLFQEHKVFNLAIFQSHSDNHSFSI